MVASLITLSILKGHSVNRLRVEGSTLHAMCEAVFKSPTLYPKASIHDSLSAFASIIYKMRLSYRVD
jgi:hypothetical protein